MAVALGKSDRLTAGGWLEVEWTPKSEPSDRARRSCPGFAVVYDDDDLVVIDKPVGVAAHPAVGWDGPTVLGALAGAGFRISTSGAAERAGIVHRLDVGTSGLMVVAKSERAYTELKRQFHDREVDKIYHAVVQGHPDPFSGTIDAPIGRHPELELEVRDRRPDGKPSVTHYETLEAMRSATLLEIHLETGRTHQIRVHMAAQRHPCVGDLLYGADPLLAARRRARAAVAARHEARIPASGHRRTGRLRDRVPGRPATRTRRPARGLRCAIRVGT